MTESALTQRQQDVLVFIEKTVDERGYPPSVREIGRPSAWRLAVDRPLATCDDAPAPRLPAAGPDQAPRHRGHR